MRNLSRLGCLTWPAILATLITFFVITGTVFAEGHGLFSPGELSTKTGSILGNVRSHAQISNDCQQCHAAPWEADRTQDRCLRCHTDIKVEMSDAHKLHGILLGKQTVLNCAKCHPEHHGATASLTDVTLNDFPHELLGFATTSHKKTPAGSPFICQSCHVNGYKAFTTQDCADCHAKIDKVFMTAHTQQYAADCRACHDGKESINKNFDHSKASFTASGGHAKLTCDQCHAGAHTLAEFKARPANCVDCHLKDDKHGDNFGTKCDTCHTQNSWKDAHFDHAITGFTLSGKHEKVVCEKCHTTPDQFKNTPNTCVGCHQKDDKHTGSEGTTCENCHTSDGWKPSTFKHESVFKLDGKHASVACQNCHTTPNQFKDAPSACVGCHLKDDTHKGTNGTDCAFCHSTSAWKPSTFDHNNASFKLTGAHTDVDCAKCHTTPGKFKGTPSECVSCHLSKDVHKGSMGTNCAVCHSPAAWKPTTFDHNKAAFKLDGKHVAVQCAQCHIDSKFKGTPQNCAGCHQKNDVHGGSEGTACQNCHHTTGWKPSTFTHNNAAFKLTGAHVSVECAKCHTTPNKFKGTSSNCVSCHLANDAHKGAMGPNCATCHSTTAWKPSTFDHSKAAFKLDGKHLAVQCAQCHINGQFKGTPMTCVACHLKNDVHGGSEGTACQNCHHTTGWKPSTFTHNNAAFKLTGAHVSVLCTKCHTTPGKFKGAPSDCVSCHLADDTHKGSNGTGCATCHSTTAWKPSTFDHNNTAFKLVGKHVSVQCGLCHTTPGQFKGTPNTCVACHLKNDVHGGTEGTACQNCHSPTAWKPSTFTHNNAAFKLTGAHVSVLCAKCHTTPGKFKGTPSDCVACHLADDTHKGSNGTGCATCHSTTAWKPSIFDHNNTAFKLVGKHVSVQCGLCHTTPGKFKGTPNTCVACHLKNDVHGGTEGTACQNCHSPAAWKPSTFNHSTIFNLVGAHTSVACAKCHTTPNQYKNAPLTCVGCHLNDDVHTGTEGTACANCHTPSAWKPSTFSHNSAAFKLTGAHVSVLCAKCHTTPGKFKGTPSTCVSCHLAKDAHKGSLGTDCAKCHTTTAWKPANFDHNTAAFKLTGKHTSVACAQCHVNGVYKGIPKTCVGCHQAKDVHAGTEGTACESCHTPAAWKPSTFNHSSVFALVGAHTSVVCAKCHTTPNQFKNAPMTCVGCHLSKDVHGGTEGTTCESCHTPSAWKPSTFNHNNAAFKLTGAHVNAVCAKCHTTPNRFKGTPSSCVSCHQAKDPHGGAFGTNCGTCHSTTAWKPSTFDHNNAAFKLTGSHTSVACAKCHINGVFKGTPTACFSCHQSKDVHGGTEGTACESCHTPAAWKPSTFNHNNAAFKLTGAHVSAVCAKCHTTPGQFKGTPSNCVSCHASKDAHGGAYGTNCGACHSTSAWKPASFDHSLSSFPLTGAHKNQACTACHVNGVYKGTPSACSSCHNEPALHAGMFGTDCASCHTTTNWNANYNGPHTFPMNHGNAKSKCSTCHPSTLSSWTCYNCHKQAEIADKHKKIGDFTNCIQCHATGKNN